MSTQEIAVLEDQDPLVDLAKMLKVNPKKLVNQLKKTVFKSCKTDEEFMAGVIVSREYGLNPFTNQIYIFPAKGGGVIPVIPIDGWIHIINNQKKYNGLKSIEHYDDKAKGGVKAITCEIHIKGRDFPVVVTEYMDECFMPNKEPWKKWPVRMLRHKAIIQCARVAFGLSGLYDEYEYDRIKLVDESPDLAIVSLKSDKAKVQESGMKQEATDAEVVEKDDKQDIDRKDIDARDVEPEDAEDSLFGDLSRFSDEDRSVIEKNIPNIEKLIDSVGHSVFESVCTWNNIDLHTSDDPDMFKRVLSKEFVNAINQQKKMSGGER